MATKGGLKTGGRTKGQPNKKSLALQERADALGVDPFEILLRFAANDWQGLGYDAKTELRYSPQGAPYEVQTIEPDVRVHAAKEACKYLHPQRKAVDHTTNGESIGNTLTDVLKQLAARNNGSS